MFYRHFSKKPEGWIVGLRLISYSIHDLEDLERIISQLEGSFHSISSFLLQEVLASQPEEMQKLILECSVFERFSAELVDAIWLPEKEFRKEGFTGESFIESLNKSNLFAISLDLENKWFRFHHLFKDLLREEMKERTDPDRIKQIYLLASQWFEDQGLTEEAMELALEGGYPVLAAEIMEKQRTNILNSDNSRLLEKCLRMIPDELVKNRLPLLLGYDRGIDPQDFYPNYIQTYIERDVRLLQNVQNLNLFVRFMKLCAGRVGQFLNLSSLANDTGVSVNTAKSWISVLEASFIIFLLQPHHKNFNKRLVKMPKLYFHDTGLASSLLGISSTEQIDTHFQFGALFENFIISELLKSRFHVGKRSNLYFWRNHKGVEIGLIIEQADSLIPVEIKSSRTYSESFFSGMNYWRKLSGSQDKQQFVVYGGKGIRETKNGILLGWDELKLIP